MSGTGMWTRSGAGVAVTDAVAAGTTAGAGDDGDSSWTRRRGGRRGGH